MQADKALALRADFVDALVAKAMILKERKQSTEAREMLELIDIEQGDAQAAYDHSKRSLELHPDLQTFSNLLLSVNYLPQVSPARVASEHFTWGRIAETMLAESRRIRSRTSSNPSSNTTTPTSSGASHGIIPRRDPAERLETFRIQD